MVDKNIKRQRGRVEREGGESERGRETGKREIERGERRWREAIFSIVWFIYTYYTNIENAP